MNNSRRGIAKIGWRFILSTVFVVGYSVSTNAAAPCRPTDDKVTVVTSHRSFAFARDWDDHRNDLAALRRAVESKDSAKFGDAIAELQQSLRIFQDYVPAREGRVCTAFAEANRDLANVERQLSEAAVDLHAASAAAIEITKISDSLRNELPTSWFVRHRDGRHFH